MTVDPVRVTREASAQELARLLETHKISGVPVVDELNRVVGVVSRTDLLHRCVAGPVGSRPGTFFASRAEGLAGGADLALDLLSRSRADGGVCATRRRSTACRTLFRTLLVEPQV